MGQVDRFDVSLCKSVCELYCSLPSHITIKACQSLSKNIADIHWVILHIRHMTCYTEFKEISQAQVFAFLCLLGMFLSAILHVMLDDTELNIKDWPVMELWDSYVC